MRFPLDRRRFLKEVGTALAATAVSRPLLVRLGRSWEPVPPIQESGLKELTARALEAARAAGAVYADVRLTHDRSRSFNGTCTDAEALGAGVRALVNGYWGFASGPIWSPDEMARLGLEAVHQARANSLGESREVDLAPLAAVSGGHWVMPVQRDPLDVSPFEVMDLLNGLAEFARARAPGIVLRATSRIPAVGAAFRAQSKAFASSAGSYCTQQLYLSRGYFSFFVETDRGEKLRRGVPALGPAGFGWELFTADRIPRVRDQSLREEIRQVLEAMEEDRRLPVKPVEVGRFDAVFDAASVQVLLDGTIERATELDRALGYEANADGTTYITDPFGMLGTQHVAAPMLTLTADRSTPGGAATVRWDDEGVVPDDVTLVKAGVLNDFQTIRESAGWLKTTYAKLGRTWRSHGCASAPSAIAPPMQFAANLAVVPGREALDYDSLVARMSRGVAIEAADVDTDFQAASGEGTGRIYQVEHGKRVARLDSAAFLFRATEFWKSLDVLGGDASLRRYGMKESKGEPEQACYYSVTAPPAAVGQLTLIDERRKA